MIRESDEERFNWESSDDDYYAESIYVRPKNMYFTPVKCHEDHQKFGGLLSPVKKLEIDKSGAY